ncbi:MAG: glycosyltransferase family 39 protein, partial [Rickettsiales bacterium]|nr:glycosyltransferase family 39 protein [Rickettsiales bacterium]
METQLFAENNRKVIELSLERRDILPLHAHILLLVLALYLLGLSQVRQALDCRVFHGGFATLVIFFFTFVGAGTEIVHPLVWFRTLWSVGHHPAWRWRELYFQYQCVFAFCVFLGAFLYWRPQFAPWAVMGEAVRSCGRLSPFWVVGVLAAAMVLLCAVLSQVLFGGLPQIPDSVSLYVQGKFFAAGKLGGDVHPFQYFFDYRFIHHNAHKVFSMYIPGHSFLLALGHVFGAPWMINPLLGGATVLAVYLLAREVAGRGAAMLAAALVLLSPFVVFMSSEFMSHSSCLLFVTLMLFAYIRQDRTGDVRYAWLAGACAGLALIMRPQAMVQVALPLALHGLWALWRQPGARLRPSLAMIGGGVPFVVFILAWNQYCNGDPFAFAVEGRNMFASTFARMDALNPERGGVFIGRAMDQYQHLHQYLFGWPGTSLVFVFLLFLLRGARPYMGLLMACVLSQAFTTIFIPFADSLLGPRYLYESCGALIVLTAVGMAELPGLLRMRLGVKTRRKTLQGMIACFVVLASVAAVPMQVMAYYPIYRDEFWAGSDRYYRFLTENIPGEALVFVRPY